MARFVKGDVVVVPFPYSDSTEAKRRPALVVAGLPGTDLILCQITSQVKRDDFSIVLDSSSFEVGSLRQSSNIRPNRLFTADQRIVVSKVGALRPAKIQEVTAKIIEIFQR